MATFKYISKDMSAKTIRGTLEADDRNDLVRKLKEQNLFLVSCQDVTKKTVNQYKMKLNELSAYSREVGTMLASGLSLIRIFSIMVRREDNKKIKKIYCSSQFRLNLSEFFKCLISIQRIIVLKVKQSQQ